jgi:hypothetical protein
MAIATKFRLNSAFKQLMSVHWWMAIVYVVLSILRTPFEKKNGRGQQKKQFIA